MRGGGRRSIRAVPRLHRRPVLREPSGAAGGEPVYGMASAYLEDNEFVDCHAEMWGGGIFLASSYLKIERTVFTRCDTISPYACAALLPTLTKYLAQCAPPYILADMPRSLYGGSSSG